MVKQDKDNNNNNNSIWTAHESKSQSLPKKLVYNKFYSVRKKTSVIFSIVLTVVRRQQIHNENFGAKVLIYMEWLIQVNIANDEVRNFQYLP